MRKHLLYVWFFLLALSSSAQVSINTNLTTGTMTSGTANLYRTAYLHFQLVNCGDNIPVIPGQPDAVVQDSFDLRPATPGSAVVGQIIGNDQITCGNVVSTYYELTAMKDASHPLRDGIPYVICSASAAIHTCGNGASLGTFNLVTADPMSQPPPVPGFVEIYGNPTNNQTINQPAGTDMTFLGSFLFPDGIFLGASTFSQLSSLVGLTNLIYISDGTPGSSPCTGGGSGSFAFYVDGSWECSLGGSGGGGGLPNEEVSFTNALSASLATSFGTTALLYQCWDNNSPANAIYPENVTVNTSTYVVTFTFAANQSGYCAVNGSGGGGSGGSGLSGMTAGQIPVAATASTVTSSEALAGSGAGITTGPTSGTIAGHVVTEVGTTGQIQDGGIPVSSLLTSSGVSGMTAGQVPIAATASTITSSAALQGTDSKILSAGTVAGTAAPLCTDSAGGATTSGCPALPASPQIGDTIRYNVNGDSAWDAVSAAPKQVTTYFDFGSGTFSTYGASNDLATILPSSGFTLINPTYTDGGAAALIGSGSASTSTVIGMDQGTGASYGDYGIGSWYRWTHRFLADNLSGRYWQGLAVYFSGGTGGNGAAILGTTSFATNTPTRSMVGFRFAGGTDTDWMACAYTAGGSGQCTSTGVAADTNPHTFEMTTTGTSVNFFIDHVLTNTVTANVPSGLLGGNSMAAMFWTGDDENTAFVVEAYEYYMSLSLK